MHVVGGKESVIDALPEAVFVNRVSEVEIGVAVVRAQRRRRHPELNGRREMVEDDPPCIVVARAAAMTLIDDDKVEELRWEGLEEPNPPLILGQRLIDREIHLAALHDLS